MAYNNRGWVSSMSTKKSDGTIFSTETYSYDTAGNLTSKVVSGSTTSFTYDDIDQLLTETRSGATTTYTYDANGNRASKSAGGVTETYVVDDADKLTSITVGGTAVKTFSYDTAGRTTSVPTSAGTTSLTYDYESRITQITYPSSATNTFTYNGLDTRVGKVDSAGTSTYKRDGDYVTAPVLEDGSAKFTPGVSDRRGTSTRFYHPDRMGSVLRHTSSSQGSTASRQYDAFGNVVAASGTFALPFGFAGNWGYQEDAASRATSGASLLRLQHRTFLDKRSGEV
jgi:YD repeat-containing protein